MKPKNKITLSSPGRFGFLTEPAQSILLILNFTNHNALVSSCLVSISLTEVGKILKKNQPEFIAFAKNGSTDRPGKSGRYAMPNTREIRTVVVSTQARSETQRPKPCRYHNALGFSWYLVDGCIRSKLCFATVYSLGGIRSTQPTVLQRNIF